MFSKPIKYVRLESLEEVKAFSYKRVEQEKAGDKKVFHMNNGRIVFIDEFGFLYVTPYRSEIIGILECAGYHEKIFPVMFFDNEERITRYRYKWLERIAEEEHWADL